MRLPTTIVHPFSDISSQCKTWNYRTICWRQAHLLNQGLVVMLFLICHFKVHKQNIWITDWNLLIFILFYPHGFDDSFKKNNNMQCYQGQKPVRETVIDVSSSSFFYWNSMLVKLNISISFWFSRHHTIYMLYFF